MYGLYCVLKGPTKPLAAEEVGFASGKKVLDPKSNSEYLKKTRGCHREHSEASP